MREIFTYNAFETVKSVNVPVYFFAGKYDYTCCYELQKEYFDLNLAIRNSTKSFIVRHKDRAVATINWPGDYGMHWFMKEFIVRREFQGQMIGTFLYRFSENFMKSTLKENWKVCIDLRFSRG